MTNNWTSYFTN